MSKHVIDLTPEALKTPERIKRNANALERWKNMQARVANGTENLLKDKSHILEMGIKAAEETGYLDADEAADMRDDLQTLKADIEEMHIAQENFLRSFRANWEEYNPPRRVKRPE